MYLHSFSALTLLAGCIFRRNKQHLANYKCWCSIPQSPSCGSFGSGV